MFFVLPTTTRIEFVCKKNQENIKKQLFSSLLLSVFVIEID